MIGNKTMLGHVASTCDMVAGYINERNTKKLFIDVAILIPQGDEIKNQDYDGLPIIEGPEHDALTRYLMLQKKYNSDYVVRITGDCPLIPFPLIIKCINTAVFNDLDYVSNVDARCRTAADGMDCEVISKRLLNYTGDNATKRYDREHVTTYMRTECDMNIFKFGSIVSFLDQSHVKLSVDTEEDLERVRAEYKRSEEIRQTAINIYGRRNVHRF
jgi:spore coat polysaccharide biosynthesis protein SpsF (cytidylyltransferase family)